MMSLQLFDIASTILINLKYCMVDKFASEIFEPLKNLPASDNKSPIFTTQAEKRWRLNTEAFCTTIFVLFQMI